MQWQLVRALLEQHQQSQRQGSSLSPRTPREAVSLSFQEAVTQTLTEVGYMWCSHLPEHVQFYSHERL